ncbi:MAG TPA: Rne/Rng family ribonuclease, partial [Tepidisphaeraceae bacterium]|nr:Rne/Rng family ribonuclease [Tepidisphaeraceae bacterium]
GNIYKGKIVNLEPSIQAAFVDFGLGRNGFLHISDLMPTYFGKKGEKVVETVGRKMARRDRPPIQQCLRRGDEIIVQIIKEGLGTKGPTLSSYLSIPGRILVMMPGVSKTGVSRKIEDEEERKRLRKILDELKPPKGVGFIIRTAGVGKTKAEIERDFKYLTRLWEDIEKKLEKNKGPGELYAEGDLVMRTVRDIYTTDVEQIIVDDKSTQKRIKDFFKLLMPRTKNKVELYEDPVPLFHKYGIERELEQMHSRTVPLASGGYLIIDQTEAVVAIDVNSGKFREHGDAETTAFKTDLEAADEIPRQLKLRDLGGVVICDFIDLRFERHRRDLETRLAENLKKDRAKTRFLRMSEFGIIEMTRQRMRPSLKRSVFHDCPGCKGHGLVKTPESMSLDVMRRLTLAINDPKVKRIELGLNGDVAFYMLNKKRASLAQLEEESGKRIQIKVDETLALDEMKFDLYDERDGLVFLSVLGMEPPLPPGRERRPERGGRSGDRRGGRGGRDGARSGRDNFRHNEDDDEREHTPEDVEDDEDAPIAARPPREPDSEESQAERERRGDMRGRFNNRGGPGGPSRGGPRESREQREAREAAERAERKRLREAERAAKASGQPMPEASHSADVGEPGTLVETSVDGVVIHEDREHDVESDSVDREPGEEDNDQEQFERRPDQPGGQYDNEGGEQQGGRRRRRRRRRRGRGGAAGDANFSGPAGPAAPNQTARPQMYSNDDGFDVGDEEPGEQPQAAQPPRADDRPQHRNDRRNDRPNNRPPRPGFQGDHRRPPQNQRPPANAIVGNAPPSEGDEDLQPPHVDHAMTSRGQDDPRNRRGGRRGRGGRGRG